MASLVKHEKIPKTPQNPLDSGSKPLPKRSLGSVALPARAVDRRGARETAGEVILHRAEKIRGAAVKNKMAAEDFDVEEMLEAPYRKVGVVL